MTRYDDLYSLLGALSSVDAVSADEGDLRSVLTERLSGLVDSVETDALGNLIAGRSASASPRLLFVHLDEPGLVVTHVDADGMLRVSPVGGISASAALGAQVRFREGARGIVVAEEGSGGGSLEFTTLRIDVGAVSKDEAEGLVSVGDRAAYDGPLSRLGDIVMGKALGSRIGCAVLIEALTRSKAGNLCMVFAAQERLGGRGLAALASGERRFDAAVGVSLVDATPRATANTAVKIGTGPALVVQDGAHVADLQLLARLSGVADAAGVGVQRYVTKEDGAKGLGSLQRMPGGTRVALVGVPARNTAGVSQIVHLNDVANAVDLLVRWIDGE